MLRYLHALHYLWNVYRILPMEGKLKRKIVSQMGTSVWNYVTKESTVNYDSIVARFGEPTQIVSMYVDEMESGELLEGLTTAKKIIYTVTVVAFTVLTLWVGVVVLSYAKHVEAVNGFYIDEVDTIYESIHEGRK